MFPDDSWFPWGEASNLLKADLQADLAFAVSQPDNSKLLAFYPNRPIFLWQGRTLRRPIVHWQAPPRAAAPQGPQVARLTTVLGWWLALSAAGAGFLAALRIGFR